MLNEGNQIHIFLSSSGSGTVNNYDSGSGSTTLHYIRENLTFKTHTPLPEPNIS